jgi:hypothetical protein
MNPKTQKIRDNVEKLRGQLWPDITPEMLWHRKRSDGFSTIPRTLSLIMVMMDTLSKGRPVSSTYLELWCRRHDEAVLILSGKEHEYSTASGFSGERAVSTWSSRLDILEQLGFIRLADGPRGARSYALLLNPYHVLKKLQPKIEKFLWNSFVARAVEIGATDMDVPKVEPIIAAPQPENKKHRVSKVG